MALQIKTAADPIEIKGLNIVIYGQPGIGKTSLAFSAKNPLLLDFDGGVHRSEFRKDYVSIAKWQDVAGISEEDLNGYDTVIIDTVDTCLDYLTVFITESNPKMKGYGGGLSLQGYGALKNMFTDFLNRLKSYHKTIIMICHVAEDKQGDNVYYRPLVKGGSKDIINQVSDLMGYSFIDNKKRSLDFNPADMWFGKNSAGFERLTIPNLAAEPDYLAEVVGTAINKMQSESEEQAELRAKWLEIAKEIGGIETVEAVNEWLGKINEIDNNSHQKMATKAVHDKAKQFGFIADTKNKCYVEAEKPKADVRAEESNEQVAS